MNEAETRAEHIDPALAAAGWGVVDGPRVRREFPITMGRLEGHGLRVRGLLRASHILPWNTHPTRRADPTNGLCLSALFDTAFDRGLITIDEDLRVIVSKRLQTAARKARLPCSLTEAHGQPLILPHRLPPDRTALEHHRINAFRQ